MAAVTVVVARRQEFGEAATGHARLTAGAERTRVEQSKTFPSVFDDGSRKPESKKTQAFFFNDL